ETCPSVKNILLLDSEGKRVAVKYYSDDWPTLSAKLAFEKSVFTKTQKANAGTEVEIVMFDGQIVVYKFIQDLHFFVTGGEEENELILASVLQGFSDAVERLLKNMVDKRTALENLDMILLCLDEIVDGGIVLETEGREIAEKGDDGVSITVGPKKKKNGMFMFFSSNFDWFRYRSMLDGMLPEHHAVFSKTPCSGVLLEKGNNSIIIDIHKFGFEQEYNIISTAHISRSCLADIFTERFPVFQYMISTSTLRALLCLGQHLIRESVHNKIKITAQIEEKNRCADLCRTGWGVGRAIHIESDIYNPCYSYIF
ncbi:hypothetical protein ACJX0J_029427, partial [Zea mays]